MADHKGDSTSSWINFYKVLNVNKEATAKEIASAYRTQALRCHPDKNADDPQAISRFHQLTKAHQVLIDSEARSAFDAVLAGRLARQERNQQFDSQRKSMRDDLLRREQEAKKRKVEESEAEVRLAQEMERLRREAVAATQKSRKVQDIEAETAKAVHFDDMDRTLKLTMTQPITEAALSSALEGYGTIESVVLSKKQKTGAVIQLDTVLTAKTILMDVTRGTIEGIAAAEWAKGSPPNLSSKCSEGKPISINSRDFESLTLMRMRQKAERAALRAKLQAEEDATK